MWHQSKEKARRSAITGHLNSEKIEHPAYISHQEASATGYKRNSFIQEAVSHQEVTKRPELSQEVFVTTGQ